MAITIMVFALWYGSGVNSVHAASSIQFRENQLTLNDADQQNPDIYEYGLNNYAVVWQDYRNGIWDIYMFYQNYLGNATWDVQWDTRITANSGSNLNPKIYNDLIVYQSNRKGNWDIYTYNITSKVETQITNNTADQQFPAIDGNIIVWQDYRNAWWDVFHNYVTGLDVYMYNLTAKTEQSLPFSEQNAFNPAISGNRVVYTGINYYPNPYSDLVQTNSYVYSYDLSTGLKTDVAAGSIIWQSEIGLTDSVFPQVNFPAIDGTLVAYTNDGTNNIAAKDLSTNATWQSNSQYVLHPDVSGDWIVYQNYYGYNYNTYWNIKLAYFSTGITYQATNTLGQQQNPALSTKYADYIVYQDYRSGHWHIYLTSFWYSAGGGSPPQEPITPSQAISNLQQINSMIGNASQIPTSDFAGANNKVKENRRNTMINQLDSAIANIEAAANTQNLKTRSKYLQNAIDQLNDLIPKVDGWSLRGSADVAGSGFTPDWITAPLYLDQMISSCRNDLQTLLNGIS